MDADLQDPPQVIPEMPQQRWREGYQVVRGTRAERESDPWSKWLFGLCYGRILDRLAKVKTSVDSGDFCLLDRLIVDTLKSLPERNRNVRGLRALDRLSPDRSTI
jgi:dolichol-phosphate mannosyltransferase